jgi:hypothetical protein
MMQSWLKTDLEVPAYLPKAFLLKQHLDVAESHFT